MFASKTNQEDLSYAVLSSKRCVDCPGVMCKLTTLSNTACSFIQLFNIVSARIAAAASRQPILRFLQDDSSSSTEQPQQQQDALSTSSPTATESGNPKIAGADAAQLQVSKEVIETLRNRVFGFDSMWVTSVDNYQQDGVVFKGNIRSKDPKVAYAKLKERLMVGFLC